MISLNWVKDYVDIENRDLKKLATEITQAGINVEKGNRKRRFNQYERVYT